MTLEFKGWWDIEEREDYPEPWEDFVVRLYGVEGGDFVPEDQFESVLRASGYRIFLEEIEPMGMTARFKSPPFVSAKLRQFARGRECQMKSEWCTGDPETVVLCHSRRRAGAGMAEKPHDFWGYHGCYDCHSNEHRVEDRELYDAIRRTQWAVYAHFGTLTPGDTK